MLTKIFCYCAVLTIFTTSVYGAPAAPNIAADNSTQRRKRQIFSNNFHFSSNNNPFIGPKAHNFLSKRFAHQQRGRPGPGQPLMFSNGGSAQVTTSTTTTTTASTSNGPTFSNNNGAANVVFINNRPVVATLPPFTAPTTSSPQFLNCFGNCLTTSEYNPICASNQQQYHNPQKFDCARRCGADIQIVRRGGCGGLFPMLRG